MKSMPRDLELSDLSHHFSCSDTLYTKVPASEIISAKPFTNNALTYRLGGLKPLTQIVKTTDDYIQCANQRKIQMSIGKQQLTLHQ